MFKVSTLKIADTTFVRCQGKIILGEDFACLRSAVMQETSTKLVVLDLACVKRIDAAGLGFLLELRERAHARAVRFKLMNARPKVEHLFRLTGLDRVFEFWSVRDMFDFMRITQLTDAVSGLWMSRTAALYEPPAA